ncbi:C6 transcription factor GliZ-like, putative [Anopheles sinensis]|uniref:C6 transcription factor GliZ-like, putative n=1 Tax=Anopheles sinensis TaxID=74873 RepID=A0A084WB35_ANOSI|nr:C6 transcription factor GliZ-like, putative [Anopheles sinensis]
MSESGGGLCFPAHKHVESCLRPTHVRSGNYFAKHREGTYHKAGNVVGFAKGESSSGHVVDVGKNSRPIPTPTWQTPFGKRRSKSNDRTRSTRCGFRLPALPAFSVPVTSFPVGEEGLALIGVEHTT